MSGLESGLLRWEIKASPPIHSKINKSVKPLLKTHKLTFTKNLVLSLEKPFRGPIFGTQNQSYFQFEEKTPESLAKLENRGLLSMAKPLNDTKQVHI